MTPAEWHAEALRLADALAEACVQHEYKSRGLVGFTRTRDAVQAARAAMSAHLLAYPVGEPVAWMRPSTLPECDPVLTQYPHVLAEWQAAECHTISPLYRNPKESV